MQLTINVKVAQTATQHRHTIQPKAVAMTVTLFVCPHAARFSSAILCVHVVAMATATSALLLQEENTNKQYFPNKQTNRHIFIIKHLFNCVNIDSV